MKNSLLLDDDEDIQIANCIKNDLKFQNIVISLLTGITN